MNPEMIIPPGTDLSQGGLLFPGYCSKRMSFRASAHTGVALSKDSLRSQSVSPWLPLWGSCHKVTERVNTPSPPPSGGTAPMGRGKALIRLALAGDARATFPLLSNCHRQLLDFNSLRGAPPQRGRLWETDCHVGRWPPRNDMVFWPSLHCLSSL